MIQEVSFELSNNQYVTIFFEIDKEKELAYPKTLNYAGKSFQEDELKELNLKPLQLSLLKEIQNDNPCKINKLLTNMSEKTLVETLKGEIL